MNESHLFMLIVDVATVIYLAWSAGRLRAGMHQNHDATLVALQTFQASLERIEASAERIAQMVRELHNR